MPDQYELITKSTPPEEIDPERAYREMLAHQLVDTIIGQVQAAGYIDGGPVTRTSQARAISYFAAGDHAHIAIDLDDDSTRVEEISLLSAAKAVTTERLERRLAYLKAMNEEDDVVEESTLRAFHPDLQGLQGIAYGIEHAIQEVTRD